MAERTGPQGEPRVKERPILFTGPSIPMVMDGTKTQTRRIADLERLSVDLPAEVRPDLWDMMPASERRIAKKGRHRVRISDQGAVFAVLPDGQPFGLEPGEFHFRCPLVDGTTSLMDLGNEKKVWTVTPVGEQRLWVKETSIIAPPRWNDRQDANATDADGVPRLVQYLATSPIKEGADDYGLKTRSSIHMPRWASRINLLPIQARLMRLQDITDEDAQAEGVTFTDYGKNAHPDVLKKLRTLPGWHYGPSTHYAECFYGARHAFANMWNRIHAGPNWNLKPGPDPWDQNPWVWAYTFRKEIA